MRVQLWQIRYMKSMKEKHGKAGKCPICLSFFTIFTATWKSFSATKSDTGGASDMSSSHGNACASPQKEHPLLNLKTHAEYVHEKHTNQLKSSNGLFYAPDSMSTRFQLIRLLFRLLLFILDIQSLPTTQGAQEHSDQLGLAPVDKADGLAADKLAWLDQLGKRKNMSGRREIIDENPLGLPYSDTHDHPVPPVNSLWLFPCACRAGNFTLSMLGARPVWRRPGMPFRHI